MSTTICPPAETQETAPGDAPVMHGDPVVSRGSYTNNRLERDGVRVTKGTLVVCEPRPVFVGQVTRVAANGILTIRWWNTTTFEESATMELPDDPYLRFLQPTPGVKPLPVAA